MIIRGAESFLLRGGERGVLMVHGFTGNPAELRLLGEHLNAAGFTVFCVRLSGHGTSVEDLFRMRQTDWFNDVLDGVSILKGICSTVSIVGHSMGGLMALRAAAMGGIERLVTLAAPMFVDESMRLNELPPRGECGDLAVPRLPRMLQNVPEGVNEVYRCMPLLSVHELVDAIEVTKSILSKVAAPILILHGTADHTACVESAQYIFDRVASIEKRIELLESMGHLLPLKDGRERVFKLTEEFLLRSGA